MNFSHVNHCCCYSGRYGLFLFFFKQEAAYEMRISDWSADVCSSDLVRIARPADAVVEVVEDFLGIHAQRIEQRRHRQPALAVDTDVDGVLGVELEIKPPAAMGHHARRKQIFARRMRLAAVTVEEEARRPVHLRQDLAIGADADY